MAPANVELVTTDGVFALDGGEWEVTNNIWLVGDDRQVVVVDAAHDHAPIVAAVAGRRVAAIALTHGHNDHINAAVALADAVEGVKAATDGYGADVVIEAVGHPEVMKQAFYSRDLAGTLVQVGVPSPTMTIDGLPMIEFFGRGGALKPSWYGDCLPSRDFPMLIDLYLQGRLDLDGFVSDTISLDGVEEAFHRMERGEVLRSVVVL